MKNSSEYTCQQNPKIVLSALELVMSVSNIQTALKLLTTCRYLNKTENRPYLKWSDIKKILDQIDKINNERTSDHIDVTSTVEIKRQIFAILETHTNIDSIKLTNSREDTVLLFNGGSNIQRGFILYKRNPAKKKPEDTPIFGMGALNEKKLEEGPFKQWFKGNFGVSGTFENGKVKSCSLIMSLDNFCR